MLPIKWNEFTAYPFSHLDSWEYYGYAYGKWMLLRRTLKLEKLDHVYHRFDQQYHSQWVSQHFNWKDISKINWPQGSLLEISQSLYPKSGGVDIIHEDLRVN